MPKALKLAQSNKKSPNLVTLLGGHEIIKVFRTFDLIMSILTYIIVSLCETINFQSLFVCFFLFLHLKEPILRVVYLCQKFLICSILQYYTNAFLGIMMSIFLNLLKLIFTTRASVLILMFSVSLYFHSFHSFVSFAS